MRSGVPPLVIALPHRRPSLLSLNSAASPHTPRSSGYFDTCPPPVCYANNKRNSTDSWTSSNAADDMMDLDWKPDQLLLLTRTLDALPAHLVTPFNGPIPPSNLLDKIARGVAHAKGPVDWPHSIRATRAKLLDLARTRAKEDVLAEKRRHIIIREEEDAVEIVEEDDHDVADKPLRGVGIGPRRPLYRQSSMDFIKPGAADLKDNPNIARLSNRLQRTDRTFPNPSYHPYARRSKQTHRQDENSRSSSPPHSSDVPALIGPSTPSSTTLNSDSVSSFLSSSSADQQQQQYPMALRQRNTLRRSASTMSSSSLFSSASSGAGGMAMDRRLQRVRRSDSFASGVPPAPPPKDYPIQTSGSLIGIKRAPSYGTLAQEARGKKGATPVKEKCGTTVKEIHATPTPGLPLPQTPPQKKKELVKETPTPKHMRQASGGSCASSDEEEKARTRRAKKMRSSASKPTNTTNTITNNNNPAEGILQSPPSSVPPSPSVGAPSAPGSPMGGIMSWGRGGLGQLGAGGGVMESPKRRAGKSYLYDRMVMGANGAGKGAVVEKEGVREKERREREVPGTPKVKKESRSKEKEKPKDKSERHASATASSTTAAAAPATTPAKARAPRMSAQRNPSMFGAELPVLKVAPGPPTATIAGAGATASDTAGQQHPLRERSALRSPRQTQTQVLMTRAPALMQSLTSTSHSTSNATTNAPAAPTKPAPSSSPDNLGLDMAMALDPPLSPGASQRVKTLRRVRRLPGARRISFGMGEGEGEGTSLGVGDGLGASLGTGGGAGGAGLGEGFVANSGAKRGLGSAFQMS